MAQNDITGRFTEQSKIIIIKNTKLKGSKRNYTYREKMVASSSPKCVQIQL